MGITSSPYAKQDDSVGGMLFDALSGSVLGDVFGCAAVEQVCDGIEVAGEIRHVRANDKSAHRTNGLSGCVISRAQPAPFHL